MGARRLLVMTAGNIFLGMGISIFKLAGMGTDPFSGMVMALAECVGIAYAHFAVLFNLVLFGAELAFGRRLIGAGTVVNACFLGYIVTFFHNIWMALWGAPELLWQRVVIVCVGVIVTSFGISMYQTPDVGVAPWDSISLIMAARWPRIPYFWCRISNDAAASLVCWLAGGVVGLGTLVCALGFGPFIAFFTRHVSRRLAGMDS